MDWTAGGMVRDRPVSRLDTAVRLSCVVLAACLSLAALAFAWGQLDRTTPISAGITPMVYRENLITGRLAFCFAREDGSTPCYSTPASSEP